MVQRPYLVPQAVQQATTLPRRIQLHYVLQSKGTLNQHVQHSRLLCRLAELPLPLPLVVFQR